MTPLDHFSPAAMTLDQISYAEQNISGDDNPNNLGDIDIDSKDGDYKFCGDVNDDDSGSNSPATAAAQKVIGDGNLKDRAKVAMLFQYSDDDYDHLYDDNLNEDEKQIENTDRNKRVKVGRGRENLIPGGLFPPNYEGMTAAEADDAKKRYNIDRQKFRENNRWERL